jgi:hypothetical protein
MTVIDTSKGKRIAFRSTQGAGVFAKDRWTEFAVYFVQEPKLGGHNFVAEIVGKSNKPGERERVTAKASHSLEEALEIFRTAGAPTSRPAAHVMEEAQTWAAAHLVDAGFDWSGFVGRIYQELGAIAAELPADLSIRPRVSALLDELCDPKGGTIAAEMGSTAA